MIKSKILNVSKDISLPCLMQHRKNGSIILVIGMDKKYITGTVVTVGNNGSYLGYYGQWEKEQFDILPVGFQIELEQR